MNDTLWLEKTWSKNEIHSEFPDVNTLGELIEATSKVARTQGGVVCEIVVNDMVLNEEQENLFILSNLDEIQTFKVRVQSLETLLDESLVGCREFLFRLVASLEKASQMFRLDDLVSAHKFYKTCVEGTQLFVDMAAHYKIVFQSVRGQLPESWADLEPKLGEVLKQVLDAYKKKNYILVADLLEYDLIDIFTKWQNQLGQLDRRGSTEQAGNSKTEDPHC